MVQRLPVTSWGHLLILLSLLQSTVIEQVMLVWGQENYVDWVEFVLGIRSFWQDVGEAAVEKRLAWLVRNLSPTYIADEITSVTVQLIEQLSLTRLLFLLVILLWIRLHVFLMFQRVVFFRSSMRWIRSWLEPMVLRL